MAAEADELTTTSLRVPRAILISDLEIEAVASYVAGLK